MLISSPSISSPGPLIDFCLGPHIPHTGKIKAFSVMKSSSAYFLGDAKNETLQRVYGVSFPDSKQMTEHKKWLEEAEKRNHRKIGKVRLSFFLWVQSEEGGEEQDLTS
jgi:threonyl-tRNA synthetase